jgi:hypothetical protein
MIQLLELLHVLYSNGLWFVPQYNDRILYLRIMNVSYSSRLIVE